MGRTTRRGIAAALTAACVLLSIAAEANAAFSYTDIVDFDLSGSWSAYGGGTQYHISTGGDGTISYRWVDTTSVDNIVSANVCSDGSQYGQWYYNAGVTVYRQLYSGSAGLCFLLMGKTAGGSVMYSRDGRLQR